MRRADRQHDRPEGLPRSGAGAARVTGASLLPGLSAAQSARHETCRRFPKHGQLQEWQGLAVRAVIGADSACQAMNRRSAKILIALHQN